MGSKSRYKKMVRETIDPVAEAARREVEREKYMKQKEQEAQFEMFKAILEGFVGGILQGQKKLVIETTFHNFRGEAVGVVLGTPSSVVIHKMSHTVKVLDTNPCSEGTSDGTE